jgi:hypothetical protein
MKTSFFTVAAWGLAVAPALAGGGGADAGAGALLIQAVGRVVAKLIDLF